MEFCPNCKILLTKIGTKFVCSKCKYMKEIVHLHSSEKIPEKKGVIVLKGDEKDSIPIIKGECPKCGHDEIYFWSTQTRGGDESETSFFKCVKCKHTWRQYT